MFQNSRDQRANSNNNNSLPPMANNRAALAVPETAANKSSRSNAPLPASSYGGSSPTTMNPSGTWLKSSTTFQITIVIVSILMASVIIAFILFCIVIYQIKPTGANNRSSGCELDRSVGLGAGQRGNADQLRTAANTDFGFNPNQRYPNQFNLGSIGPQANDQMKKFNLADQHMSGSNNLPLLTTVFCDPKTGQSSILLSSIPNGSVSTTIGENQFHSSNFDCASELL